VLGRPLRLLAAVAAPAVLLATVAACSGGGSGRPDPSSTTSATAASTSTVSVPESDSLQVVEQGVTSFPDPYTRGQNLGGYGVVLLNPNPGLLAAGVHVTTRILDTAGTELLVDNALLNGVMPGQRMAVGRTLVEPIANPTQLDIHIEVSAWLPPAPGLGALTATEALTEPEQFGGAVTHFAVQSTSANEEDGVDVAAVYRAADGHILAAETTSIDALNPGETVVGQIRLLSPIPGLATTEVLVGRGLSAQITG
jgi:hypothetical protein